MQTIKWGIIGPGAIATAFAYSIQGIDNSELIGVFGRSKEKTIHFANSFNLKSYDIFEDFISSNEIDAVYIATPHSDHFIYALAAIKNNKHILCEKPLTMNSYESMILLDLAQSSEVFLMEAYMYRVHPQTLNILNNLYLLKEDNKKILIEGSFGFKADVAKDHRLRNPALGGGAILDVGCYPLSMSKLIAGHLQGLPFAEPKSIEASGRIDETGTDLQSEAYLVFSDVIEASINCAIDEELTNTLIISNGEISITANDPWHCGQSEDGTSCITISNGSDLTQEIPYKDNLGLFAREIEHASSCILNKKIESEFITHLDTQSNMFWLDQWRQKMGIACPKNSIEYSPILQAHAFLYQTPKLESVAVQGLDKLGSRLAFGCDNQTSDVHAFTMFDNFYGAGGRIFDTAYIYNNGMGDKYLGQWINSRQLEQEIVVLGKAAHTPQCKPEFIRPQIIESLERLKIEKLDIFCLHRDNLEVPVSEFIDALTEIKEEGLIGLIGASNWELDRFSEARDYAIQKHKEPFTVLSNNFSLAEMIEPVWPGCVGVNDLYIEYLIKESVMLFPWSSQARGFFIQKKEIMSTEHFANPNLDEEMRVWHYEKNLKRREKCFELAAQKNVQPIQIALSYVLHKSPLIFPLVGPRTIFETNSSVHASQLKLTEQELLQLAQD